MEVKNKLKTLPNSPGIYKFLDKKERVIYVGKAKNLKKRVTNYFQQGTKHSPKNQKLIKNTFDLEWIETNTEQEAILLETNFIKELHPKYNILMKDDKNFVYIKITLNEDYPRVLIVRKMEKDEAKYFGPKTSKSAVEQTLKTLTKIFPFRDCNYEISGEGEEVKVKGASRNLPCLQYHIKKCLGPCIGEITKTEYREIIEQIILFLKGNTAEIKKHLQAEMQKFALEKKFEKAAKLRDNFFAVEKISSKQIISEANFEERDVFGYVQDLGKTFFTLLQIREGKMIGQENFIVEGENLETEEISIILEEFLKQYYSSATDIPKEILLPIVLNQDKENEMTINDLKDFLCNLAGQSVKLFVPQKGKKNALVDLAEKNARAYAKQNRIKWMEERQIDYDKLLEELGEKLDLEEKIKRMECYDISHLGGTDTVGSMVVFQNGKPKNQDYRHFKLRSLEEGEIDDFKAMKEVLERRLKYLAFKDEKNILGKNYQIRKGKKLDEEFIQKIAQNEELDTVDFDVKEFLVLEKNVEAKEIVLKKKEGNQKKATKEMEIVGFVRIKHYNDKVKEIGTLWIKEKERAKGFETLLCLEIIRRSKLAKVYAVGTSEILKFYFNVGFQEIYDLPKEIEERLKTRGFKKENYKYFAYIKSKQEQIDKSFTSTPDLIVIDGGKGQLGVVTEVLKDYNLQIPLVSLAKKEEEIFLPERKEPISIEANSEISFLIQRLRDESHRFANTFNRDLRSKRMVTSKLDEIVGIGPKMKQQLLQRFGSVEGIKQAGDGEIMGIVGKGMMLKLRKEL